MKENKELISSLEGKETWSKPELEMVSVKESTLAAFATTFDGIINS